MKTAEVVEATDQIHACDQGLCLLRQIARTACKYANYAVTCTSASLTSGSSATIKITVTVNKTAKVGKELVNNATVSSVTYDPVLTDNTVVQKTMVAK